MSIEKWSFFPTAGVEGTLREVMCSERYLRAQVLRGLGRHAEALRWLRYLGPTFAESVYIAQKHFLSAEIYEELGETDQAIHHYEQFVDLWQDCDPELQHHVADAHERIARLRGEMTGK